MRWIRTGSVGDGKLESVFNPTAHHRDFIFFFAWADILYSILCGNFFSPSFCSGLKISFDNRHDFARCWINYYYALSAKESVEINQKWIFFLQLLRRIPPFDQNWWLFGMKIWKLIYSVVFTWKATKVFPLKSNAWIDFSILYILEPLSIWTAKSPFHAILKFCETAKCSN